MLDKFRIVNKVLYWGVFALLIFVAFIVFATTLGLPNKTRLLVVKSGSMEPNIKAGSLIFTKEIGKYKVGDVITYKIKQDADIANPKSTVTHRIVDIKTQDGKTSFITKGDANQSEDIMQPNLNQVVGKVVLSIPYLGYPVAYAKTQTGFVLLVVIPATLIIYSELTKLLADVKRLAMEGKLGKFFKKEEK